MATVKFRKDNEYSVVDLEYVSAEYSGAGIHAQELELDATDFATDVAENGMCLVVANGVVTKPDKISDHVCLLATEPEIYEEGKGRKSFAVKRDKGSQPRLFEIVRGDVFSTNAATYDSTEIGRAHV